MEKELFEKLMKLFEKEFEVIGNSIHFVNGIIIELRRDPSMGYHDYLFIYSRDVKIEAIKLFPLLSIERHKELFNKFKTCLALYEKETNTKSVIKLLDTVK